MSTQTWLKPEQVQSLRDACYSRRSDGITAQRNDAIIALMYDAGVRTMETTEITVEMFDADDKVLRLPSSIQKDYPNSGSPPPATIELARTDSTKDTVRTVQNYLQSRDSSSDYLFSSERGDTITPQTIRRRIVKPAAIEADVRPYEGYQGRAGPKDVSPYSLRHSVAYRLLSNNDGYTLYDVRNRLRHSSINTTERHYDMFDRR